MPRPHDLLHLVAAEVAILTRAWPEWVKPALAMAPYVVVRREASTPGKVAVGVRGSTRAERFGSFLEFRHGTVPITPESLAQACGWRTSPYRDRVPALRALDAVAAAMSLAGWRWGPGGSVGFELATGRSSATHTSDLDIVVQCPRRFEKRHVAEMLVALDGGCCRIDVILETPAGGVSLLDLAHSTGAILARTSRGPMWVTDPWALAVPAPACS